MKRRRKKKVRPGRLRPSPMHHSVVSISQPKLRTTLFPVCEKRRVVGLRGEVHQGDIRHAIEIDRHGTLTLLDHPSIDMLAAFHAFGAARPPCLRVYESYNLDPFDWLRMHRVFQNITSDGFVELALRYAERALTHADRSATLDWERQQELAGLVAATRDYLAAGNEIPAVRGMVAEKERLRRRATDFEYVAFQTDDTIGERIVRTVTQAVEVVVHVVSQGVPPVSVIVFIATFEHKAAPDPVAERRWQAGQLIQVMDGGKLCRS
jgi:hypothetical protein